MSYFVLRNNRVIINDSVENPNNFSCVDKFTMEELYCRKGVLIPVCGGLERTAFYLNNDHMGLNMFTCCGKDPGHQSAGVEYGILIDPNGDIYATSFKLMSDDDVTYYPRISLASLNKRSRFIVYAENNHITECLHYTQKLQHHLSNEDYITKALEAAMSSTRSNVKGSPLHIDMTFLTEHAKIAVEEFKSIPISKKP